MAVTSQQTEGALKIVLAVGDAIRDLGETPAGVLYAHLSSTGMTLQQFESIIATLQRVGVVERRSPNTNFDVIRWIGPKGA